MLRYCWFESKSNFVYYLHRRQGQAFQSRGGGLTSYWSPRPQFIRPFQSYQQHTSSPLAPIQAFHTDFPNFIPAIGYPLSTYFTAPISQAQVVTLQVPVRRSSDQIKHVSCDPVVPHGPPCYVIN